MQPLGSIRAHLKPRRLLRLPHPFSRDGELEAMVFQGEPHRGRLPNPEHFTVLEGTSRGDAARRVRNPERYSRFHPDFSDVADDVQAWA